MQPSILLQYGTDIQLSWDPETILPMITEYNSFMVDVYVYTYEKKTQEWSQNVKHKSLQNTGQAQINLGLISDKKSVFATCIHVTVGKTTGSSSPNTRDFLERFHMATVPFPNRTGLWSGLVFSTHNTAGLSAERTKASLKNKFIRKCSGWRMQEAEKISEDVIKSLPSCPPTLDRAQLPNSGLEEQRLDSVSYTTMYHDMWMSYFHNNIAKCFTQVIVTRLIDYSYRLQLRMNDKSNSPSADSYIRNLVSRFSVRYYCVHTHCIRKKSYQLTHMHYTYRRRLLNLLIMLHKAYGLYLNFSLRYSLPCCKYIITISIVIIL